MYSFVRRDGTKLVTINSNRCICYKIKSNGSLVDICTVTIHDGIVECIEKSKTVTKGENTLYKSKNRNDIVEYFDERSISHSLINKDDTFHWINENLKCDSLLFKFALTFLTNVSFCSIKKGKSYCEKKIEGKLNRFFASLDYEKSISEKRDVVILGI